MNAASSGAAAGTPRSPASPDRTAGAHAVRGAPQTAPDEPGRIVALAPSAAEILFALGAAPRVVGVSDFAADLPESAGKPRLGGFSPDLERVVALRPDLVVVSRDGTDRAAFEKLRALGLRVLVNEGRDVEGVLSDVTRVGKAMGLSARAADLVASLSRRVDAASARARRRGRTPSVAVLIWPDPPVVAGPQTFVGDLLARAAARNVVPASAGEWPRVSLETLAAWNPDVLVRPETRENAGAFSRLLSDPRWRSVPAARAGRLLTLPGNLLERPGPRLVDALEALVEKLEEAR